MPDYPLWTASTALVGGKPVHYLCDEENNWYPDIEDIKSKITERTKGIVVINPNNPTGAVYPRSILKQIVDVAREHGFGRILRRNLREDCLRWRRSHQHGLLTGDDVLCLTFSGLSKAYRVSVTVRAGWPSPARRRTPPAIWKVSTCSPRCVCALTCRHSTRCRPRWAATSPSTS